MKNLAFTIISALWAAGFTAGAQTLTPENVADRIIEVSPEFRGLHLEQEALRESLKTDSNLPDPEIEGEYLFAPAGETNRWGAGISWGIDWPGAYAARRKEADGKVRAGEAALLAARRERLTEVKRLLLDYVLQEKQLEVLQRINAANDSIIVLAGVANKGGEMTRLDFNKLNLEKASLNAGIAAVLDERASTLTQLSAIYGSNCGDLLKDMQCAFPLLEVPAEIIDNYSFAASPTVKSADAEAEAARRAIGVASMEALPGLSVGYRHAFEDGTHFNGASLGISIPLFSSRNKKKAATAALKAAEYKAEAAKAVTRQQVEGAIRRFSILKNQLNEITPIIEDADNEALLQKAYSGGLITLLDYLNERNYFTEATLRLQELRHAAANAILDISTHLP